HPPTVSAGGTYTIREGDALALDASASADADGDPLSYSWTVNGHAGAAVGARPTLTWAQLAALGTPITDAGTFTVSVHVNDGRGWSAESAPATLTVLPVVYWTDPAGGDWDNPGN